MDRFDVIIIGGRVAGTTLAVRLGQAGMRVLLLERDTMPSLPAVSSPIIYAPAMQLLDEIGADEADYAHNTPRIQQWVIEAEDIFRVSEPIPMVAGRDYGYAIDRERFDGALWELAAKQPCVQAFDQTAVIDLLWEGERVVGVRAKHIASGERRDYRSKLVVGADGRFSLVARSVSATEYDEHDERPTSNYYANWKNVSPVNGGVPSAHMLSTGGDYGLLFMDSADDMTVIAIEGRTDRMTFASGDVESFYRDMLNRHPSIRERLRNAKMMTPVSGMKKIGNTYRQAGGDGWALVGDALHQKDPLDGQGIYDALFGAKMLANAILRWRRGEVNWSIAVADYEQGVRAETEAMYRSTMARVQREIYTRRPRWFMRTFARWLYEDAGYRRHWAKLFVRQIPPEDWFRWQVIMPPVLRGAWADVKSWVRRTHSGG